MGGRYRREEREREVRPRRDGKSAQGIESKRVEEGPLRKRVRKMKNIKGIARKHAETSARWSV